MLQHAASRSRQSQPPLLPLSRGGVGLTGDLALAPAALSRVGRGSTILSLNNTDPGLFLLYPKKFLARDFNCSLGRSPRWKGGHRGQGGGGELELRKGRVGAEP